MCKCNMLCSQLNLHHNSKVDLPLLYVVHRWQMIAEIKSQYWVNYNVVDFCSNFLLFENARCGLMKWYKYGAQNQIRIKCTYSTYRIKLVKQFGRQVIVRLLCVEGHAIIYRVSWTVAFIYLYMHTFYRCATVLLWN